MLGLVACGAGGTQSSVERLESSLDSSLSDALSDEGFGDARHIQCVGFQSGHGTCTADIPLGPDIFRDTYSVTLNPNGCWQARETGFGRLTGRDAESVPLPRHLSGCSRG